MSQAPIAPGATEMAPDDPLFLRFDGRAPARVLLEVLEAARSAWIWKVGLLYWTDQPPYECLLKTFLPPLDAPDDPPRILTLRADAEGGADVQRQGRSIDWRTEPPPLWNEEPQVAVAPDLSVMALIDVLRRWTPTRSITAAR